MSTSSDTSAHDRALRNADVLDNAVYASLTGSHTHLARRHGRAVRYLGEVSPFAALPTSPAATIGATLPPSSTIQRAWRLPRLAPRPRRIGRSWCGSRAFK